MPKLKLSWVFLAVFLLFGLYLRVWHLDFPSIGYHNMKENEYLVPAYYFYEGDWQGLDILRRPYFLCGVEQPKCYFEEYPQIPMLSWVAALGWLVFGVNFWWPHMLVVICSLLAIVGIYALVKQVSKSTYLSLVSAFIFTFLPLGVFFGRNFQPESPALVFAIFGSYFFVKWIDDPTKQNMGLAGGFFCMAALMKMTFLIALLPLAAIFPYNRLKQKEYYRHFLIFAACFLPFLLWNFVISGHLNVVEATFQDTLKRVDLFRVFGAQYWNDYLPTLQAYTLDNFAGWYFKFAILGLIAMVITWRERISRYMLAYALSIVPYLMMLADYFKGHSYYQYPFLPVVAIASAYLLWWAGKLLVRLSSRKLLLFLPLLIMIPTYNAVQERINVQYDTLFYGLDVGGKYIQDHTAENEYFYMVGHPQTVGVCFAAKRVCPGMPRSNVSMVIKGENNLNISYVFVHGQQGMALLQEFPQTWEHVSNSYHIVSIGFFRFGDNILPQYFILKRGGNFTLNSQLAGPSFEARTYTTKTQGTLTLYEMDLE